MPYGDPLLTNSAGAGYGPVLYLSHLPFQFLLNPEAAEPRRVLQSGLQAPLITI